MPRRSVAGVCFHLVVSNGWQMRGRSRAVTVGSTMTAAARVGCVFLPR